LYFGGLNHDHGLDAERGDKYDMMLPYGQVEVIKELLDVNQNTVLVMISGGPFDMQQWIDKALTLLYTSYNGMEGGNSLVRILSGEVNPSGKLFVSFPKKLADSPAHKLGEFPGDSSDVNYNEGIFVGYRGFDKLDIKPR